MMSTSRNLVISICIIVPIFCPVTLAQRNSVCQGRPNTGGCRKSDKVTRFIYDKNMGSCLRVIACPNDNGNNFESKEACTDTCVNSASDPSTTAKCFNNPCDSWQELCPQAAYCIPMYCNGCKRKLYDDYFDEIPESQCSDGGPKNQSPCYGIDCGTCKTCVPFSSNCLGAHCKPYTCVDDVRCKNPGNRRNFSTCAGTLCRRGLECQLVDGTPQCVNQQCTLPVDPGPCNANIHAWYYDVTTRDCQPFSYGGCGGNENRFQSQQMCDRTCSKDRDVSEHRRHFESPCLRSCNPGLECKLNNGFEQCVPSSAANDQCKLARDPGPCTGYFPMWYYDDQTMRCEQFIYGGCRGNENRFQTREICESACLQNQGQEQCLLSCKTGYECVLRQGFEQCVPISEHSDQCHLPKDPGPCHGSFQMWYFNQETDCCDQFTYGGCGGNKNRFETKELCDRACKQETRHCSLTCKPGYKCESFNGLDQCVPVSTSERCNLPKDPGPCRGSFVMWHHNAKTKRCEQFLYGGCNGNENRFETRQMCEDTCIQDQGHEECLLSCTPGYECKNLRGVQQCVPRSDTTQRTCTLPKDAGPCHGNLRKWYFNVQTRQCELFTYGGCGGNENRFDTKELCETMCNGNQGVQQCSLSCKQGYQCKIFQGYEICVPASEMPEECSLPQDPGPCRATITMWYYNARTQRCDQFIYGGCRGNKNRFQTKEMCEAKCSQNQGPQKCSLTCKSGYECKLLNGFEQCVPISGPFHKCSLPKDTGPCRENVRKWHFNVQTGRCEQFIYGGCGGNENRFDTEEMCQRTCSIDQRQRQCSLLCKHGYECKVINGLDQCVPASELSEECSLPKNPGPCKARVTMWYFNAQTNRCEQFIYGGCMGNKNRFATKQMCERTCIPRQRSCSLTCKPGYECQVIHGFEQCVQVSGQSAGKCSLKKDPGECYGYFPSWFYNAQSRQCEQFIYGGCGGNENRFETKSMCERACSQPQRCPSIQPPSNIPADCKLTPRIQDGCTFYDIVCDKPQHCSLPCKSGFECRVVHGLEQCVEAEEVDKCKMPLDAGPCRGNIIMWYHNTQTRRCEQFRYGGCRGNENRFQTREMCERTCIQNQPDCPVMQPPGNVPTGCRLNQTVTQDGCSTYEIVCDSPQQSCTLPCRTGYECRFVQGFQQCVESNRSPPEECQLPKDPGPCYAHFPSWFYKAIANQCEQFIYGGCDGNKNRFDSQEICERICK